MSKQQPIGQTFLRMIGRLIISLLTIAAIIIASCLKWAGIVITKIAEFILSQLANK